jgi:GGDEF domain-containing protein
MKKLSDRLTRNLDKASRQGEEPVLRLSFGYSLSQDSRDSLENVVQRADYLMYQNKRRKKGEECQD